jgi:uncharacterized protein with ParB-like and HNH nuclease domain
VKKPLTLKDVRPQLPFNINYGMADLSIKEILDPNWNITFDWDVYLPTKGMNLQRPFVWTLQQKQELIYSVFKGIQLPPISIIQYRDDDRNITYKIIDGKQRLSTLIAFVKNEFPIIWDNQEYYFDELDHSIKGEFLYHGVIRSNIGYEYPDKLISDDDKIKWFQIINFAGTPQDKEHQEKLLKNLK